MPAKREEPPSAAPKLEVPSSAPKLDVQETAASQPGLADAAMKSAGESEVHDRGVAGIVQCPVCDYPASGRVQNCPMCGSSLKVEATLPPFVDPGQAPQVVQPQMILERLGIQPEEAPTSLPFAATDGDVNVNRQDVDQNNFSITSKTQASFLFRDGRWWLLDRSDLKTTFVQVREAVELKEGDIILMGDRKFIFHPSGDGGPGND